MQSFEVLTDEQQDQLYNTTEAAELQNIVNLFNLNLKKKELMRVSKLSTLQDSIIDQAEQRIAKHSDEFSNRDLIDYFKTFQDVLVKTNTQEIVNNPIQITQNQINFNIETPEFDLDSRKRIFNAVKKILSSQSQQEELVTIDEQEVTCETN